MTKYLLMMMTAGMFFTACQGQPAATTENAAETATEAPLEETNWEVRGEKIVAEGALSPAEMLAVYNEQGGFEGKIKTEIIACCQKKGCWMKVDLGNGEEMRVTFKDYGFFVPMDSKGSEVIMQGKAFADTVTVDMLKHYAEDAGKSTEEIEAITEPEVAIAFEATGVLVEAKN